MKSIRMVGSWVKVKMQDLYAKGKDRCTKRMNRILKLKTRKKTQIRIHRTLAMMKSTRAKRMKRNHGTHMKMKTSCAKVKTSCSRKKMHSKRKVVQFYLTHYERDLELKILRTLLIKKRFLEPKAKLYTMKGNKVQLIEQRKSHN